MASPWVAGVKIAGIKLKMIRDKSHGVKIAGIKLKVGLPEAPTAPKLDIWAVLVSLILSPWGMACPKLVCLGAWACFGPIEPDSCSLIGCAFCLDLWSVFPCS